MARPTKRTAKLAETIGEPASRVQGWTERGLGPADPDADPVEHYRHLPPLLGTGRDDSVAVLKMAADGYPCRCLRDVLAGLAHQGAETVADADELVEHFMADETVADLRDLMVTQARQLPVPGEWAAMPEAPLSRDEMDELAKHQSQHLAERAATALDEPGRADLLARSAALPIADAVVGSPVEPGDLADLDRLGGWEQLGMPAMPFDDDGAERSRSALYKAREIVRASHEWIRTAPADELARGVGAARVIVDAWAVLHPGVALWGDEHRWRRIGDMAPMAVQILAVTFAALDDVGGMELAPNMRRYMDAMKTGRSFVTPGDPQPSPHPDEVHPGEST